MNFDDTYPKPSSLFYKRHEISQVVSMDAENILIPKILNLFPKAKKKTELFVNTYFEKVLQFEPKQSYIVRFRQRGRLKSNTKKVKFPRKWLLEGPGTLEIKIKELSGKGSETKTGTFISGKKGKDINELLRLARNPKNKKGLVQFMQNANCEQRNATENKHLRLIDVDKFLKIAEDLSLFAARVNIRHSFELEDVEEARITFETTPTFYAYPIEHKTFNKCISKNKYEGYLAEKAKRAKIEIKSKTKKRGLEVFNLLKTHINKLRVPENKYSEIPYYKMIITTSKEVGVVVDEARGREIEGKAAIPKDVNIEQEMNNLRIKLLTAHNLPYRLFSTEPDMGVRDYAEKNRTIFGWQDQNNNWHEVATLIRISKRGLAEYSFPAILKRKADTINNSGQILDRNADFKFLTELPTKQNIIKKLMSEVGKKVVAVKTCKKTKYRIYVQDKGGRNFCVSLDNIKVYGNEQMQQLEVEYVHTVKMNSNTPATTVSSACEKCLDYFIKMLSNQGIGAKRTKIRKIDYLASLAN